MGGASVGNRVFSAEKQLSTAKDVGISDSFTAGINATVTELIHDRGKKSKQYTAFLEEQWADIGTYAVEHGNNAALKKFHGGIPYLGESMVRLFKKYFTH